MCFDCSGVALENSAICVFFLIRYGVSVVLVTLTAILLWYIDDIEKEKSKLAHSVNFSNGVTVTVVVHPNVRSTKAVNFVVLDDYFRASSLMTGWCFAVASLEAVLTCIVMCGECMRPWLLSLTTLLLFLTKCNPINGLVIFFITKKYSAILFSPNSNVSVAVVNGFSNWPLATCIWKAGGFVDFEDITRSVLFYCVQVFLGKCTDIGSWVQQGICC